MCNQAPLRMANPGSAASSQPAKAPLPIQQMPGTTVAKVEDPSGKLAAFGALVRYSNNQGYFILQQLDNQLSQKAVTVSMPEIDDPLNLRIENIQEQFPMRSHLPVYLQVHHNPSERLILEHLIDNLFETTLGRQNLELKKNVTIDLFDSDSDAFMRDRAGFFVADRQQFRQLTVQSSEALPVLKLDEKTVVEKFHRDQLADLIDYDNSLSAQTRPDFLEYLTNNCKVYVAKPVTTTTKQTAKTSKTRDENAEKEEKQDEKEKPSLSGYMVVGGEVANRVLALYAQSQEVANTLLRTYIKESKAKTVTFCSVRDHWHHLANLPHTSERPIYRRHTRAVPSNVKWEQIYAINIGLNLF